MQFCSSKALTRCDLEKDANHAGPMVYTRRRRPSRNDLYPNNIALSCRRLAQGAWQHRSMHTTVWEERAREREREKGGFGERREVFGGLAFIWQYTHASGTTVVVECSLAPPNKSHPKSPSDNQMTTPGRYVKKKTISIQLVQFFEIGSNEMLRGWQLLALPTGHSQRELATGRAMAPLAAWPEKLG